MLEVDEDYSNNFSLGLTATQQMMPMSQKGS